MDRLKPIYEQFYARFPYYGNVGVVDVETTGFASNARLIEIGFIAIMFDGFSVSFKTFETLINPGEQITPKITEVTGITNDELKNAPGDEIYPWFVEVIQKASPRFMVAHNASFDEGKIKYNLGRVNANITLPPFECTMKLSRRSNHVVANDQLKTLAAHYNFENKQAHRALADAETCAYIFAKMKLGE